MRRVSGRPIDASMALIRIRQKAGAAVDGRGRGVVMKRRGEAEHSSGRFALNSSRHLVVPKSWYMKGSCQSVGRGRISQQRYRHFLPWRNSLLNPNSRLSAASARLRGDSSGEEASSFTSREPAVRLNGAGGSMTGLRVKAVTKHSRAGAELIVSDRRKLSRAQSLGVRLRSW